MEGCVNQFYLFLFIVQKILYCLRTHSVSSNCIFMNLYHIQLYIWQVIFPVDEKTFLGQDLHLLESMEFNQKVKPVQEIIEGIEWQGLDPDLLTRSIIHTLTVFPFFCALSLVCQTKTLNSISQSLSLFLIFCSFQFLASKASLVAHLKTVLMNPRPRPLIYLWVHILFLFLVDVILAAYLLIDKKYWLYAFSRLIIPQNFFLIPCMF